MKKSDDQSRIYAKKGPSPSYWVDHDDSYLVLDHIDMSGVKCPLNATTVQANYITDIPNNIEQIEFCKSDDSSCFEICDSNTSIVTNYHRSDTRCWGVDDRRYKAICAGSCDCELSESKDNKKLCKKYDTETRKHPFRSRMVPSSSTLETDSSLNESSTTDSNMSKHKKEKVCSKYSNKYINTACLCDSVALIKKRMPKIDCTSKRKTPNVSFNSNDSVIRSPTSKRK